MAGISERIQYARKYLEEKIEIDREDKGNLVLRSQFDRALKCLKHGKAVG